MFHVLGQYLPYFIELEDGWTWYSKYVAKELNLLTGLATFHVSRLFPFRSTVWQCDVTVWQNASVTYQVSTQPAPHVSTYLWDFGFIDEKIMIMYFLFSQFTVLDKNYFLRLLQYHCICMKYVKSQFDSDQFEGCTWLRCAATGTFITHHWFTPEVSKHREGLQLFAYEDEDGARGGGVEVSPADSWCWMDMSVSVSQCVVQSETKSSTGRLQKHMKLYLTIWLYLTWLINL